MRFSTAEAEEWVREQVENIGIGYHPDTRFEDYIDKGTGKRLFSDDEARELNALSDAAFDRLGNDIYDVALEAIQRAWDEAEGA